jgi:hypothetical protein
MQSAKQTDQWIARPGFRVLAGILALASFFGVAISGFPMIQNGLGIVPLMNVTLFTLLGVRCRIWR